MPLVALAVLSFSTGAVAAVSSGATAPVSAALAVEQPVAASEPTIITTAVIVLRESFMIVFLPNLVLGAGEDVLVLVVFGEDLQQPAGQPGKPAGDRDLGRDLRQAGVARRH